MKAAISFTIFGDYYKNVKGVIYNDNEDEDFDFYDSVDYDEYDYDAALDKLNEELTQLVRKNELVFKYKNKKAKIILPITIENTGNIFGKDGDEWDDTYWEGVEIWCEIDDDDEFDSKQLKVTKCPNYFTPESVNLEY